MRGPSRAGSRQSRKRRRKTAGTQHAESGAGPQKNKTSHPPPGPSQKEKEKGSWTPPWHDSRPPLKVLTEEFQTMGFGNPWMDIGGGGRRGGGQVTPQDVQHDPSVSSAWNPTRWGELVEVSGSTREMQRSARSAQIQPHSGLRS